MRSHGKLPPVSSQPDAALTDLLPLAPPRFEAGAPLCIVMNAGSGRQDAAQAREAIAAVLAGAGRPHEFLVLEPGASVAAVAAEAVRRARAAGGAVVAAGGDGTLNAVAQAVLPAGLPFGALPRGTFNYFCRAQGIPAEIGPATQALLRARPAPVQVGCVNGRLFLVNASVGLYPQLLEDREAFKRRYGRSRWVALWSALVTLFHAHRPLRLQLDCQGVQQRLRTSTLFVGNNALQLRQFGIPEAEVLAQGRLAAVMLRPVGTLAMLGLMLQGAFGRLGEAEDVLHFAFERLAVRPAAPRRTAKVKLATDGEICWLRAPLAFSVAPQPLWLLAPSAEDRVAPA